MSIVVSLFAQIVHLVLVLLAAPFVAGVMGWLDARFAGRSGPPVLLPWRDLVRLSRKTMAIPESASPVLSWAPSVNLGATVCAAALIPSFTLGMTLAPLADGLVIAALLSLARVARCLGALDTGSAASGMAAQHAGALATLTEPALLLFVFGLALMGDGFNLDLIIGQQREGLLLPAAASAVALACLLALVFADASDAADDLELDISGINLAVSRFSIWLRRVIWIDLIGGLFLPIGMAGTTGGPREWAVGLVCWAVKLALAVLCLSSIRTLLGQVARRDLADLAGIAAVLALLAIIIVLVSAGTA
ncbi:NADH-quinone oxidoreductase subunit H [Rhodopila sp.]|uniref:NADH-quinone oxidoreductase subunit H n=1 Tax=Rhodopila sp. TaxID=2480087 RepID=UPI003D11A584